MQQKNIKIKKKLAKQNNMEIKFFKEQNFNQLKNRHSSANLFIDPEFGPNINSLVVSEDGRTRFDYYNIKWKRPRVLSNLLI